jgi:hypothetical protein
VERWRFVIFVMVAGDASKYQVLMNIGSAVTVEACSNVCAQRCRPVRSVRLFAVVGQRATIRPVDFCTSACLLNRYGTYQAVA